MDEVIEVIGRLEVVLPALVDRYKLHLTERDKTAASKVNAALEALYGVANGLFDGEVSADTALETVDRYAGEFNVQY